MTKQASVQEQAGLKPWMAYTILGVAIFVAGFVVYRWWTAEQGQQAIAMFCVTDGCGYTTSHKYTKEDSGILVCPKCSKQSLMPAINCPRCGTPTVWNENRGLPPPTKCKKCGLEMTHGARNG